MSLEDAIAQMQSLAPKSPGHLIRAEDWNTLITSLGEFGATLTTQAADLEAIKGRVDDLEGELEQVRTETVALEAKVDKLEPLLSNYVVTLACDRINYASGEICELTVKVTDLLGAPLPAPFPWVDLVAAWGRLRQQPGVTTQPGAGDNALSVQVNAQGVARVQLRAEHSEGLSESEDLDVEAVMHLQVPGTGNNVAQAFLTAPTPSDPKSEAAFKLVHKEYERADAKGFRFYADAYYANTPTYTLYPPGKSAFNRWRDNRATVIALAKPDANPTTADGARGAASIQVNFRDWLGPWVDDYVADDKELRDDLAKDYDVVIHGTNPLQKLREKVNPELDKRGLVGRKKYLAVAEKAMDGVNVGNDVKLQQVKDQATKGIGAQRATEIYASSQGGAVLDAHLEQGTALEVVAGNVAEVGKEVDKTRALQQNVNVLEGRMQASERVGQQIQSGLTFINDNVRAINPLDGDSLKGSVNKISAEIAALKAALPGG